MIELFIFMKSLYAVSAPGCLMSWQGRHAWLTILHRARWSWMRQFDRISPSRPAWCYQWFAYIPNIDKLVCEAVSFLRIVIRDVIATSQVTVEGKNPTRWRVTYKQSHWLNFVLRAAQSVFWVCVGDRVGWPLTTLDVRCRCRRRHDF